MFEIINKLLWAVATFLILYVGMYYTIKLKFVQLHIKRMFKELKNSNNSQMSPLKILTLTLAGRIGIGSIAGIAIAITSGGVGTILWMWIFSLLTAPNAFVEATLGVIYKKQDGSYYKGGPSYYIDNGLNNKKLAIAYSIIIILAYIFGFLTIQANTISVLFSNYINVSKIAIGILLSITTTLSIIKGLETITNVTIKIVPLMGLLYLLVGIFITANNITSIPILLKEIFKSALNFNSFKDGFLITMLIGLQRGIFANESGLGTGAITSGASDSNNITSQGYVQIIGVYFTTLIICTTTALIIMTSDYKIQDLQNYNGIELIQYALNFHLGSLGDIILSVTIFLFAFSTIITIYYYGEISLKYLLPNIKEKNLILLKLIISIVVVYGSIEKARFLWNVVDILVAILAIINIYSIYKLKYKLLEKMRKQ